VIAARKRTSPAPGRPQGNVEKSLCTNASANANAFRTRAPASKVLERRPSFEGLQIDNPALQTDRHGVRAIVGRELGEDVLDVALDGFFGD